MDNEEIKAIELSGIAHNVSKIGSKDGQCEDIVNFRLKDGSWRVATECKQVYSMVAGYRNLYVHTGPGYKHLLGVYTSGSVSTLYWFAIISDDGETITPLSSNTTPSSPVAITNVVGDVNIVQNGHLLTIQDSNSFFYILFKSGSNEYIKMKTDEEKSESRGMYPYGSVHFNLYSPNEEANEETVKDKHVYKFTSDSATYTNMRNKFIYAYGFAKKHNLLTRPFLAVAAIKMYDGTYMYASNPQLIYPRQSCSSRYFDTEGDQQYHTFDKTQMKRFLNVSTLSYNNGVLVGGIHTCSKLTPANDKVSYKGTTTAYIDENWIPPVVEYGMYVRSRARVILPNGYVLYGSDLVITIDNELFSVINNNKDLFKSICIFITPEIDEYDLSTSFISPTNESFWYNDIVRSNDKIQYDLEHSNFYLLKEYYVDEVSSLVDSRIVEFDINDGLESLTTHDTLPTESFSRVTTCPKVEYMYNGRLHIADYKERQYHGYPVDVFNLNNQNVKIQSGSYYKGVLKNIVANGVEDTQWPRTEYNFPDSQDDAPFVIERIKIETSSGDQYVVRYIPEYIHTTSVNGRADFLQDIDPLISFPDSRATEITIYIKVDSIGGYCGYKSIVKELKPHPFLGIAYHLSDNFKPIQFGQALQPQPPEYWNNLLIEVNNVENKTNYMKVSKMDNPLFFPVGNTYQVGSSRIVSLMSNAISIGTGQTGASPLFVFCTDGIYALLVDATGSIAYSNSSIIARDVCNNVRSVTPTDYGIVFTTDRGLMVISGNEVKEIGEILEGDYCKFIDNTSELDYSKILYNAYSFTRLAGLQAASATNTDFLTYLRNSIVCYNHNEKELIITNPLKVYSYVMDQYGNWSRRDWSATEYVNNYPTSYRLYNDILYKIDKEDNLTTNNGLFVLSKEIKLDSIGFKELHRVVLRGWFKTASSTSIFGLYIFGSYDGRKWACIGHREKAGEFTDLGALTERTDCKFFRIAFAGKLDYSSRLDYIEISSRTSKLSTKIR